MFVMNFDQQASLFAKHDFFQVFVHLNTFKNENLTSTVLSEMSAFVIRGLNFTTKPYNFDFDFLKDLEHSFTKTSCFLCRMMVILVHDHLKYNRKLSIAHIFPKF